MEMGLSVGESNEEAQGQTFIIEKLLINLKAINSLMIRFSVIQFSVLVQEKAL